MSVQPKKISDQYIDKTEGSMMEEVSEKSGTLPKKIRLRMSLYPPAKFLERIDRRQEKMRHTGAEIAEIRRSSNLQDQLDMLRSCIKKDPCNHLLWHERWLVAKRLGTSAASEELKFTEEILSVHARNNFAWSYRQLFLREPEGAESELAFCNELLQKDTYNGCAWDQRLFAAWACKAETNEELKYAKEFILKDPTNEYPWIYLRNLLCKEIKYDAKAEFEDAKGSFLKHCEKGFPDIGYLNRDFDLELDNIYKLVFEDCIRLVTELKNKLGDEFDKVLLPNATSRLVHALDTLKDLVGLGYYPSVEITNVLMKIGLGSYAANGFLMDLSPLGDVFPLKKHNWECGAVCVHYRE